MREFEKAVLRWREIKRERRRAVKQEKIKKIINL
jgi:hypothetical protein